MEFAWIMGGFMALCIFVFLAVAFLFPEWVGIQGKVAKKIEAGHRQQSDLPESSSAPRDSADSNISKLQ